MIKTKFQETFDDGILSKKDFQNSEITKAFAEWLIPFIDGRKNLLEFKYEYNNYSSLNEAILGYRWGKENDEENFELTYKRFEKYRNIFKTANDEELRNTCIEILKWGGVLPRNKEKINQRKNLRTFLTQINSLVQSDELIIDDLNPNHINSGYTKIYTALNSNFIMYDGRVGASLGFIVRRYLEEKGKTQIPSELNFGWGAGRGTSNRDPGNTIFKFTNITQNRTLHFISNIKVNWLLEMIAKDDSVKIVQTNNHAERVFALQTALFELGKKLPDKSK